MIQHIRLRRVLEGDFRWNEASLYREFTKKEQALAASFKEDDAVCFVSKTGTQILFVYRVREVEGREVLTSVRLRLPSGTWNPLLLQNYAAEVGLHLVGHKFFEEHFREAQRRREQGEAGAASKAA